MHDPGDDIQAQSSALEVVNRFPHGGLFEFGRGGVDEVAEAVPQLLPFVTCDHRFGEQVRCLLGEWVACKASQVRPWKLPSNASTLRAVGREQLIRHSAIAFSFDSEPLDTNVTCGNPGTSWRSVFA